MGQDYGIVNQKLVTYNNVFAKNTCALYSDPLAYYVLPTYYAFFDKRVFFNHRIV